MSLAPVKVGIAGRSGRQSMKSYDYAVIGGGIVGLATAFMLNRRQPRAQVLVLEKEPALACHQTGRNSGVIHSGVYYTPGSFKAKFALAGNRSMVEFCRRHDLPHEICGKVIVATEPFELPRLEALFQRGQDNGLEVTRLSPDQVREVEPHVRCLAGMRVPSTGIVNYTQVCSKLGELIQQAGGAIELGAQVVKILDRGTCHVVVTAKGDYETKFLINCAGLHSDRVARFARVDPEAKIIPFRGEYYELLPEKRHLVRNLIYPVPNPDFPFLGVHYTRMIDGSVHAGPNAVLAFKREGYHKSDFSAHDFWETLAFGGFWKLAWRNLGEGWQEMRRSFLKSVFVKSLQRMIPEVRSEDLMPAASGVRAQAVRSDGRLVDDFLIAPGRNALHVCNAPSPAATAALEIGRHIAAQVPASSCN